MAACSKNNTDATASRGVDYSTYKIQTAIHRLNGTTDTTRYTYTGNTVSIVINYSDNPGVLYTTNYTKQTGSYSSQNYTASALTMNGYFRLNSQGYIDSAATVRSNGTTNNISTYAYDAGGYNTREIARYSGYENNYFKYEANGNPTYWINRFTNFTTPAQNKVDSIVFETDPLRASFVVYKPHLPEIYGKPLKNLVTKRTYYNALTGVAYESWEYEYTTDAIGLVTREIWKVYRLPDRLLTRSDTTWLSYTQVR